jgi:hypothetical protein
MRLADRWTPFRLINFRIEWVIRKKSNNLFFKRKVSIYDEKKFPIRKKYFEKEDKTDKKALLLTILDAIIQK